jgi:hypothetical protein
LRSKRESEWKENILEQGIFREIYNVIRANRGREFPEEVNNPCVLNILWGGKTSSWKRQATWVIDKFVISIARAISIFFETVCPDEDLRENIRSWLSERLHEVSQNARKELDNLITDEAKAIWTVNPQRAKQVVKLRNNRIKAMTEELEDLESQEKDEENSDEEEYQDAETRIKSWLETNGVMAAVFNTHDHLVAYYDVAMDRFIDNVGLQVVERHLLGPSNPLQIFTAQYVVQESEKDETFLERIARERVSKREQREAWNRKKENLKRALQTAEDYGFLGQ